MEAKIILITTLLWTVSAFGQLNKIGLENYKVTSITVADNSYYEKFIVAGTENDGMYFHQIADDDSVWSNLFKNNRGMSSLYAQELDSANTKLFWALKLDTIRYSPLIYSNVMPVQSAIVAEDSGLDKSKVQTIKSFAGFDYLSNDQSMSVFCCTNDPNIYKYSARSWSKVWEGPDIVNFNFVYTCNSSVWAGGIFNGFIAAPLLLKSTDCGITWDTLHLPLGEIHSCYSMCVSPLNNNIVFVGLNENILKSADGGKTWATCLSNIHDVVFTGLLINPQKPEQIYAGGKYFNNDFRFFKSDDNGKSWLQPNIYSNYIIKGLNTMKGTIENGKYVIYLGTDDGIYKYAENVTLVNKERLHLNNFYLFPNYPNPFNPSTKIKYQLPQSGMVLLKIIDMLGREIKTLAEEYQNAGVHEVNFNASDIASGVYFYKVASGNFSSVKKMVLVR